jgi:peptidoglycan/xylan/chitin deacetylase (PgdA/CDA1 family)
MTPLHRLFFRNASVGCVLFFLFFAFLNGFGTAGRAGETPKRSVAVTFDDLPGNSVRDFDVKRAFNEKLVASIRRNQVPAVGFVNEGQCYDGETLFESRVEILKLWTDAGLELGNHTRTHRDFNLITLEEVKWEVAEGEAITRRLLAEKGGKLRYFRHPFLHTGGTAEKRKAIEAFLAGRGYTLAPVTIDNEEWVFARAYELALVDGNAALQKKIRDAYAPYLESVFAYYERQSDVLFARQISQILLLHSNQLNADTFDDLAAMMTRRGYRFVTLETALTDKAYETVDTYNGPAGITWLHRWVLGPGKKKLLVPNEPETPGFVWEASKLSRS